MKKSALVPTIMNDEIRVNSVKDSYLYDLDIEYPSTSIKHVGSLESSTACISHILEQESSTKVDVQLEKMVQTFDTYIPEPLRNADGSPIYVHANGGRAVRTTDNSKSTDWRYKIGIFDHVDAEKTTTAERIRKLSG